MKFRPKEIFRQLYFVANESFWIIVFCVSFASIVTILESSFHMKLVIQNDSLVPGFATLLILRELGAVVTGLLLTSRVGAGYASEVATMKITEQIEALKMLGIRPVEYLLGPRLIASVLGTILLVALGNVICILCAMVVSQLYLGFSPSMFLAAMRRFVHFSDYVTSLVKAGFFGAVIPIISCYFGFRSRSGADGVGEATTQSVVFASIAIIVLDFVLSLTFSYIV